MLLRGKIRNLLKKIILLISPNFRLLSGIRYRLDILLERVRILENLNNQIGDLAIKNERKIDILMDATEHIENNTLIFSDIDDHLVVFQGDIDLIGNSRAYFEYIYANHKDKYNFMWILQDELIENNLPKDIEIVYISERDFDKKAQRAKYVVHSSVQLFEKVAGQVGINLWHGTPIKTIGFTEKIAQKHYYIFKNDNFFVSSDYSKLIFAACFKVNYDKIFITGQPRNDIILRNTKTLNFFEKVLGIELSKFKIIIIYSPTFKSVKIWDNTPEINDVMDNIFYFKDYDVEKLNNFLIERDVLLLVKPHFADEASFRELDINRSNIFVAYDNFFIKHNCHLYDFFIFFDAMITDYSSIYLDYLILNRPIIFNHSTESSYSDSRGFIIEDNFSFFMPGMKIKSQAGLLTAIEDAIGADVNKEEREKFRLLFNKYFDAESCSRVFEVMKNL